MEGWIKSASHRHNLLNSNYNAVGFAVMTRPDSAWKIYWVTIFRRTDFGVHHDG